MESNNKNSYSYSSEKLPDFANPENLIHVNETTYNVFEDWLKVAQKHYDIDTEAIKSPDGDETLDDAEVNLLKTGLFGYTNEIMAQEVKNAVAHRNVLYDEYFINTASFPESIYKFAKTYNVPISVAQPAHMLVKLAIRKSDLVSSPLRTEIVEEQYVKNTTLKTYEVILDRSYPFNVGKYQYLLPYDVIITLRQRSNNDYSITARYDIDNNLYKFTEFPKVEINTYQDVSNGQEYVYLDLDIYQLTSTKSTFNVISNNLAENLIFTAQYPDQIAGFNVYYNYLGESYPLNLYFNNMYTPTDPEEKFAYYTFVDDDKLQISFSSLPNTFKPAYNSTITIEVLSSKGSEGNFIFNGQIQYSLENIDKSSFRTMLVSVAPLTSSSGGRDRLTIEQEKMKIINRITTRNNLVTENDLQNYFIEFNEISNTNGSQIKFMKKRDDVLLRVYNAFLLMKDNEQMILPSTTAPLIQIPIQWFKDNNNGNDQDGYVIPEHSIFRYNFSSEKYEYVKDGYTDELAEEMKGDKDNLIYANPFLIRIDVDPILNAYYYKLDINQAFDTDYNYRNSLVDSTLAINQVKVEKTVTFEEDLSSDTYNITLELNSNHSIQELDDKISIRGLLMNEKTGEKYGYFEFERDKSVVDSQNSSDSTYISHLSTNRKFRQGKLAITDSLYDRDGNVQDNVFIDEACVIKIGVLWHDPEKQYRTNDRVNPETSMYYDAFPSDLQRDYNINDYVLATSVSTNQTVYLYRDLSDIMTSTVYRNPTQTNRPIKTRDFMVEMIPLVGLEYFQANNEYLYSLLDNYIGALEEILPRLENNTKIDLKFYNTRGPSKHFYLNSEVQMDDVFTVDLNRTDILLDFTVHLYETINDEFDLALKDFIADYIEASNEAGLVPISNLITLIENTFDVVSYIEFNGISGTYLDRVSNKYQRIMSREQDLKYMNKQEVIEYVPEYLNVKKQLHDNWVTIEDPDTGRTSRTSIGKRYENVINLQYVVD